MKALNRPAWERWVDLATLAVLFVALAYVALTTAWMFNAHAMRVPYWDQWTEILPQQYLREPFSQHNEHRIFVGRVFFALDAWLFRAQGRLCFAVIGLGLLGTALLVAGAVARPGNPRRFLPAFALSATLLFAAYSWENLLWGFQASFVPLYPAAVGAFVAMARRSERWGWLLVALLCASIAAATMANGVLVAPLLVVLALLLGRPRWHLAVLAIFSALVFASYLHGYKTPSHHADPWSSIRSPFAVLRYAAVYFGGPLSWRFEQDRISAATLIGAVGLGLSALLGAIAIGRRHRLEPADWVLPFTMLFIVGTGLITALGRLNFRIEQAVESRYGTPVLLFWCAVVAHMMRSATRPWARVSVSALACAIALGVGSEQLFHERIAAARLLGLRSAETALLAGALDKSAIDQVTPAAYLVENALPTYRGRRWSVFAEPWFDWIGQPLSRHIGQRDDGACLGSLERAMLVPTYGAPGFRMEGWAYSLRSKAPAERIALIDEQGVVRGFALTGYPRPDLPKFHQEVRSNRAGLVGHVASLPGDSVEVVGVVLLDGGRTACHLQKSVRLN